jgi:putative CocE/NonD family hydrolase
VGILSRLIAKRLGLRPHYAIGVRRKVRVPMPDGVELLTDVHTPRGLTSGPTVLIRSPYGRRPFGFAMAVPLATQGYHVVVQSCRGTAGSAGVFDPHHDEHHDGLATVEWITRQPWYDGSIVTFGGSYLGYTQWAIAQAAGPEVKAMAMQVTLSDFSQMTYSGNSLMLENALSWTHMVTMMKRTRGKLQMMLRMLLGRPAISAQQWRSLPLASLDEVTTGQRVPFWRDWMEHGSAEDPWWEPMDFHRTIPDVQRPITLVAGWHDIFAPWSLRDFAALQRAGAPARITIGPWVHTDRSPGGIVMHDALDWFAHHLGQRPSTRSEPVKLFVMGVDEWRLFDQWPPKESVPATWYLQPGSGLADHPAEDSQPDRYRYDPADPTPSVGGPGLSPRPFSVDNATLESRSDVLCFTSAPLADDLDLIGVPAAELCVSSSATSADFFVRLCDVDEAGVSRNVCDGLQRIAIRPDRSPQPVRIELWPTAYRFRRGHRLRVQVSSGAFPRWARNLGSDDSLATGTEMRVAEQSIHHSPAYPSALTLPICAPTS